MFKALKILKNQKGIIHLIPLFLILIGIAAGVYLVQHPTIFKPKASANIIEWQIGGENNCITSVDSNNYATATCARIKFKLNLPSADQMSDKGSIMSSIASIASVSLVKTAYAVDGIYFADLGFGGVGFNQYKYSCKGDTVVKNHYDFWGGRQITWESQDNVFNCGGLGKICYADSDGNAQCIQSILKLNAPEEQPPAAGSSNAGDNLTLDQKTTRWFCKDNQVWRQYWIDPTDLSKGQSQIFNGGGDDDCNVGGKQCEEFVNEGAQGAAANGDATCVAKTAAAGEEAANVDVDTTPVPAQPTAVVPGGQTVINRGTTLPAGNKNCPETKDNPYPQCGNTVGLEGLPVNLTYMVTAIRCNKDIIRYERDEGRDLGQCQKAPAGEPGASATPTTAPTSVPVTSTTSNRTIVEYRTAINGSVDYTEWKPYSENMAPVSLILLNGNGGYLIYVQFKDSNDQIVNNKAANTDYWEGFVQLNPSSPTEAATTTTASLSADLLVNPTTVVKNANGYPKIQIIVQGATKPWTLYYQEKPGVNCGGSCDAGWGSFTTNDVLKAGLEVGNGFGEKGNSKFFWTPPAYVTGIHTIALIDGSVIIQKDITFQDNTPVGSIPAGSPCSAYETTTVCGGSTKTYDKCIDEQGQSGSSLCTNAASKFYCVGSTNLNCDSRYDDTQKKIVEGTYQYSCSACPNLRDRSSSQNGD